jgi:glucose/arabinose dehydrogenase
LLLTIDKPFPNHDGGLLKFGPDDGYLYLGTGDGGAGDDPGNRAQNPKELLGKMLRIDINHRDAGLAYAIPKDNPFVGNPDYRPEIWTIGMRNPWRYSFDRKTHELYAGDVGQDHWEEIDLITKGGNYGWRVIEATHQNIKYPDAVILPAVPAAISPIFEYPHPTPPPGKPFGAACIIGGYVYRGAAIPELQGQYVFADYSMSWLGTIKVENGKVSSKNIGNKLTFDLEHVVNGNNVTSHVLPQLSSFGEDADGELYALDYGHSMLLKLVPAK